MGFTTSDPKIYNKMKYRGFARELEIEDYYSLLFPLTQMGYRWDADKKYMKQMGEGYLTAETPWVHAKGTPFKHCNLDHRITFSCFNIIPPRCLNCWKVVVTPTTLTQLFELEQIELQMNVPSKCGIEMRDYTPKFYGGYFYNHSLDEGRERYEQVRKMVDSNMTNGKDVSVILKRGCTEFEMIKGPSHAWHNTRWEEYMLEVIDAFVHSPRGTGEQSRLVKNHVKLKWFLWAHMNGDMSYKELNGGESLFPDYVKYHEGDIDLIKRDIIVSHAASKAGIKPGDSDDFLKIAEDFAENREIPEIGLLSHSLGADSFSRTNLVRSTPLHQVVPEETKGEEDGLT
jgi:hypothetical protein